MRVIIFGSMNTDLCYQLDAFPRAGETISALSFNILNGGKGANQAISAARCGAKAVMIGAVGHDEYGQSHINTLHHENIDTSHIQRVDAPTGIANIYIDKHGQNNIVLNAGANALCRAAQLKQSEVTAEDVVIVQMEVAHGEIIAALQHAKAQGATTILNLAPVPKIFPEDLFDHVDYLIANELEALAVYNYISGAQQREVVPYTAQAKLISESLQCHCIITRGAQGAYAQMMQGNTINADAMPINAQDLIDTTGAGDSFSGAFAAALSLQQPVELALKFAAYAGSLACLKLGAQTALPTAADVTDALQGNQTVHTASI